MEPEGRGVIIRLIVTNFCSALETTTIFHDVESTLDLISTFFIGAGIPFGECAVLARSNSRVKTSANAVRYPKASKTCHKHLSATLSIRS